MAIADTITSMQTHTTNAYNTLAYATDLTGVNKNLANLKQCIFDSLINSMSNTLNPTWNNLPKIATTAGTSQSINNTIEAPMRTTLSPSELTQDSTPTPSSPQNIHSISGSNKIVVSNGNGVSQEAEVYLGGLNKFNVNTIREQFLNTTNGSTSPNNSWKCTPFEDNLKPNTTYTLSWVSSSSFFQANVVFYDSSQTFVSSAELTRNGYYNNSFTTPSSFKYYRLSYSTNVGGNEVNRDNIMLNEGSTAQPYIEYITPIEYSKISTYEDTFIRTSGKNLIDNSQIVKGRLDDGVLGYASNTTALSYTESSITFTTNANYRGIVSDYIEVNANSDYTYKSSSIRTGLGITFSCYDSNKTYLGGANRIYPDDYTIVATTLTNTKYVRIAIQLNTAGTTTITEPMFNLGNQATTFEPYGSNQWYIKKAIGKVVLDGTEEWTIHSLGNNNYLLRHPMSNYMKNVVIYTNYYKGIQNQDNRTLYDAYLRNDNTLSLDILDNSYTSADDFKTWLTTHNLIVDYVLATPTYTQITGTLAEQLENIYNAYSKDGMTNLSQINNDLPFVINASALEDLA